LAPLMQGLWSIDVRDVFHTCVKKHKPLHHNNLLLSIIVVHPREHSSFYVRARKVGNQRYKTILFYFFLQYVQKWTNDSYSTSHTTLFISGPLPFASGEPVLIDILWSVPQILFIHPSIHVTACFIRELKNISTRWSGSSVRS